jgi:hypothetical protein
MHPLVRAAAAVAVISAIGLYARPRAAPPPPAPAPSGAPPLAEMPCGPRAIPEGDVCVPLPDSSWALSPANAERKSAREAPRSHDLIPRRPDRPADPLALLYPVDPPVRVAFFGLGTAGTDPEDAASALTEGAVDLVVDRGAAVKVASLEGQSTKAEIVALGELFGTTVVTRHEVSENGRKRQYLVFYGRLDALGPDVAIDRALDEGAVVGFAGDSGTPGFVHLHLEVRQVRGDLDVHPLEIGRLGDQSVGIPCDVRNVLRPRP